MITPLFAAPLIAAALALILNVYWMSFVQLCVSLTVLLTASFILHNPDTITFGTWFMLDGPGRIVLITAAFLDFWVALYSFGYVRSDIRSPETMRKYRFYYFWKNLFILSMMTSICANNLGIYWVGLEATTLTTAFLVAFYGNRAALETAWKYVMMCSVGISIGLFSIVILFFASSQIFGSRIQAFSFIDLIQNAGTLDKNLLMLGFILALVGFGTKAGLAPMHQWLPDAHSQAPSPVSSLLSGVLLNTALLGIIRFYQLNNAAGNSLAANYLIAFGGLTVFVAAFLMLRQTEFKRLFAYSSMENIGIITLGLGLGGLAAWGSFLHIFLHALHKAILFFCAGNIITKLHEKSATRITGLFYMMPKTAIALVIGLLGIAGLPPFSLFISKFAIICGCFRYSLSGGIALLLLLVLGLGGLLLRIVPMIVGTPSHNESYHLHPNMIWIPFGMIVVSIVMLLWLPADLIFWLTKSVDQLGGSI